MKRKEVLQEFNSMYGSLLQKNDILLSMIFPLGLIHLLPQTKAIKTQFSIVLRLKAETQKKLILNL